MVAKPTAAQLDRMSFEDLQQFKRDAHQPSGARAQAARPYLMAEGDSWFDYPIGTDILDCLAAFHGYEVKKTYSKAGDTIENMAYGTRFSPMNGYRPLPNDMPDILMEVHRRRPEAFLISGGGNDVAGDEFAQFLNHAGSGKPRFRRDFADYMINTVFRTAYADMIWQVSSVQPGITIVGHGYGYPIPDGRGVGFGVGLSFVGPWLRPALAAKRIDPMSDGVPIIEELMDMFNQMLESLESEFTNFRYVDLRELIGRDKNSWANELHVTNSVYRRIAAAIHAELRAAAPASAPHSALRGAKRSGRGRAPAKRRPRSRAGVRRGGKGAK